MEAATRAVQGNVEDAVDPAQEVNARTPPTQGPVAAPRGLSASSVSAAMSTTTSAFRPPRCVSTSEFALYRLPCLP